MKISIIIPCFNTGYLLNNLLSNIAVNKEYVEIIIIDDCSGDDSYEIAENIANNYPEVIKVYRTKENSGPGVARNIGIDNAIGDYLLFLDSDDRLLEGAVKKLLTHVSKENSDIVAFNWRFSDNSHHGTAARNEGRTDLSSLKKIKIQLLQDYIEFKMDGSVIYTLIKKDIISKNNIRFFCGFHEDVDFIFKVYFLSESIGILDEIIYEKNNRENSIINTLTTKHIDGIFRAYCSICDFLQDRGICDEEILKSQAIGLVVLVATRLREAIFLENSNSLSEIFYSIYLNSNMLIEMYGVLVPEINTKYFMIYNYFMDSYKVENKYEGVEEIKKNLSDIIEKSWSCFDIQNSLFMAPDEIRTCCKRFFSDGVMKGDVVLLDRELSSEFNFDDVINAKKALHTRINQNTSDECSGCPFLEFKKWGDFSEFKIQYLSLEYHSICNMKCVYCSDKYYGGIKENYNVKKILLEMFEAGFFAENLQLVWGGGEPTLSKQFEDILNMFSAKKGIQQRVITNAVKYIPALQKAVDNNSAVIVTSIDAGTESTFKKIRLSSKFNQVFRNIKKYSALNPKNVTLKYILLEDNCAVEEINNFANKVSDEGVVRCNFQISCDFQYECLNIDLAVASVYIYYKLVTIGASMVYFDDLLRIRLANFYIDNQAVINNELYDLKALSIIEKPETYENVVIWGAGQQTKYLIENSYFFTKIKKVILVDDTPEKIGSLFLGYKIYNPDILLGNNYSVVISAAQAAPKILKKFNLLEINKDRLIMGLIL